MGLGPKEAALKAQREARAGRGGKNPRTASPSPKHEAVVRRRARLEAAAGPPVDMLLAASGRPAVAEDRIIFGAPAGLRARLEVVRRSRGDRSLSETIRVLLEAGLAK